MASFFSANRQEETKNILASLRNSLNTFVFGSQGIGKTTIAKSIVKEYCNKIGEGIYVDCLLYQTANSILREILFSLGCIISSKSNYDLAKRLKEKARKLKIVVFLDHVENLKNYEILNFLFGFNIPVCMVSTNFTGYKRIDPSMRSRIPNIVKISNPLKEDVLNILLERPGSIDDALLDEISEKVCGNITLAVNLVESIKARNTTAGLIEDFFSYQNVNIASISVDCKAILQILTQKKKLPSGELFKLYQKITEFPKSERSFRKYMETLKNRSLVRSIGEKKGRIYEIIEKKKIEEELECLRTK